MTVRAAPVIAAVAAVALAGCGGGPSPSADAGRTLSAPPTPVSSAASSPAGTPAAPRARPSLAERIEQAERTVADPASSAVDVRRAAQFEQLASRTLAAAGERARRRVMSALEGRAASVMAADVDAATSLNALTEAQPALPRGWRIVAPLPPRQLMRLYRSAQRSTGVPWEYLAAVNLVETRFGRIVGPSTAGAQGPMQFLPATFAEYGEGGDIHDPADAIPAAARLLAANGAPRNMAGALLAYNNSSSYGNAVTAYAGAVRLATP
jgi:membrane-bound lytic murein transglycosylase B